MPSLLRTHQLHLVDDILLKHWGNVDNWAGNALLNVPDTKHFNIRVRPQGPCWDDEFILIGIAPKDADLTQQDIQAHTGIFLSLMSDDLEILRPDVEDSVIEVPGWSFEGVQELQMTYEEGLLYFSCEGHPRVRVEGPIPAADYRPCFSIYDKSARIRIAVDSPPRKRKHEDDESHIAKFAKRLWASKQFTDATVVCGGVAIPVHRCALVSASLFFERAFQVAMRESAEAKVVIEDADPGSVEFLLAYLYTGVVDSHCNPDAAALLPLAHRLEVPDLVDHCAATLVKELSEESVARTVATLQPYAKEPAVSQYWDTIAHRVQSDIQLVYALMATLVAPAASAIPMGA